VMAGADFILVGDMIWQDSRGPATALDEVGQAIRQAYAATRQAERAGQGSL